MKDFFKDLKIIELAGVLAGPSVGLFFSELGARVLKVENPKTKGDVTRSWKLISENPDDDSSAYYWSVNAGKQVLFLDLSQEQDLQIFYQELKDTDVVITNYKLGDDKKLKVDYDTLASIKPDLIYASINGFGKDSPRTAYDLILQAESGFMFMNGEKKSSPTKMPVALIDILAGHQLKEAVLLALLKKYKTGSGSQVSVSLFDTAIASLANQATNWLIAHHLPVSQGSLHPNIAPYGELFQTRDLHIITFAIGSDKQFKQLCSLLENEALADDIRFIHNQQRIQNREALFAELDKKISGKDFDSIYQDCLKYDVPIGKIRTLKEVFELEEAGKMLNTFEYQAQELRSVRSTAFIFEK